MPNYPELTFNNDQFIPSRKSNDTPNKKQNVSSLYENDADPDPTSNDFFRDDIDDFHSQREKILLDKGVRNDDAEDTDNEEEVLAVVSEDDLSDEDDEEINMYRKQMRRLKQARVRERIASDLEDSEDGLPDSKAWGSKRSRFYGTDVVDNRIDLAGSDEDMEGMAALEEKEALAIQKRMADELDDQDFGLDVFKPATRTDDKSGDQEKIVKDLSKLSKREKLEILKKESPELLTLIKDFTDKMTELRDVIQPLLTLVNDGKIQGKEAKYIKVKFQLHLNYCVNVSFYLMLKAKHAPASSHPVVKRLVQYRNLMKQLESVDEKLGPEVEDLLERLKRGEEIDFSPRETSQHANTNRRKNAEIKAKKLLKKRSLKNSEDDTSLENSHLPKKKAKDDRYETKDEKEALEYYKMMRGAGDDLNNNDEDDDNLESNDMEMTEGNDGNEEFDVDGKRAITYQMAKNKGMRAHKKKELRNPRVKHRMKYRKAKIRRKGQIREVRTEVKPYGGELSGIRAGIKRSIKLK